MTLVLVLVCTYVRQYSHAVKLIVAEVYHQRATLSAPKRPKLSDFAFEHQINSKCVKNFEKKVLRHNQVLFPEKL